MYFLPGTGKNIYTRLAQWLHQRLQFSRRANQFSQQVRICLLSKTEYHRITPSHHLTHSVHHLTGKTYPARQLTTILIGA